MKKVLISLQKDKYLLFLSIGVLLFVLYISLASILRYEHFMAGKLDLGNMLQTMWNTFHGGFFQFTDPYSTQNLSRLATHADFILILIAPLYALFPSPWTILIFQAGIVGIGAYAVYLVAKQITNNSLYATFFGFLYLMNPSVQRSSLYDFHAVVLCTTILLFIWYFMLQKRWGWFLVFCLLAGITKEQVWIITGLLGLYVAAKYKKYILGGVLSILSFGLFFFLIQYAIPQANSGPHFVLKFYSEYGDGTSSITKSVLTDPINVFMTITNQERQSFLWQLFSPLAFFSFLAPLLMIFMAPELMGYLVSNNINMHQIYYQYTATLTPFIFIAAIYGFAFVMSRIKKDTLGRGVAIVFFVVSLFFAHRYSPLPYSHEPQIDMFRSFTSNELEVRAYLKTVPPDASVSASNYLGSHLAKRKQLYIYPIGHTEADYVIIDRNRDKEQSLQESTTLKKDFENARFVSYRRVVE